MGINSERDVEANMQIGPTDQGMVRLSSKPRVSKSRWILIRRKPKKSQTSCAPQPRPPASLQAKTAYSPAFGP
jgi:hypothetical protein